MHWCTTRCNTPSCFNFKISFQMCIIKCLYLLIGFPTNRWSKDFSTSASAGSRRYLCLRQSFCTHVNEINLSDIYSHIFCIIHQEANLVQIKISFLCWLLPWKPVISLLAGRAGAVLRGLLFNLHLHSACVPRAYKTPPLEHVTLLLNETCCKFKIGVDRVWRAAVMFL